MAKGPYDPCLARDAALYHSLQQKRPLTDVEFEPAGASTGKTHDTINNACLAGAWRTDQRGGLSVPRDKGQIVDCGDASEGERQMLDDQQRLMKFAHSAPISAVDSDSALCSVCTALTF